MASMKVPEQKVILVGEYGVGKSSLFRRFTTNTFVTATDRSVTLGLDNYSKSYDVYGKAMKLQLWDTGGMERVASITSSYYKYSEAAILVFALDRVESFHVLAQHMLDITMYAETAKIFLCGNKFDLKSRVQVSDADMDRFCEECRNLVSGVYKTSCKTGEGVDYMFKDISQKLASSNKSRMELKAMEEVSFKIEPAIEATESNSCNAC